MSRVEKCQTSHVDIGHVSSPNSQKAMDVILALLTSCVGPSGKIHMVRNSCGGHTTMTSASSRLLSTMSITRSELKLIVSSVQAHLSQHGDCGLFMACMCLHLIKSSVSLGPHFHAHPSLYESFVHIITTYLNSPECKICVKADFTDLQVLLAYIRSVVSSKSLLNLTRTDCDSLSELVMKAFVESIPTQTTSRDTPNSDGIHIVSIENKHIRESRLEKGLLLEYPELPIIKGPVHLNVKSVHRFQGITDNNLDGGSENCVKVALITCSMSGDAEEISDTSYEVTEELSEYMDNVVLGKMEELCDKFDQADVGLVLCQRVIHPHVKTVLRSKGILFVDRLGSQGIPYLQDITGARPIASVISPPVLIDHLGHVDAVSHMVEGGRSFLCLSRLDSCVVTLVVCAQWEERLAELKHCVKTTLIGLRSLVKEPRLLAGGGCWQIHSSRYLVDQVQQQLSSLAQEAGCSEAQVLTAMKSFQSSLHHWARCLADDTQDLLVDTSHCHCWRVPKGRRLESDMLETDISLCSCGLKSVPTKCLEEFDMVTGHEHFSLNSKTDFDKPVFVTDNTNCSHMVLDNFAAATQALYKGVFTSNLILSVGQFITDRN